MDTPPLPTPEPPPPPPSPKPDLPLSQWKVILHLSGLAGLLVPTANILLPLVIWLLKKTDLPALDAEGRKVLNFQISYAIYTLAAVVIAITLSCLYVPVALPAIVGIAWLVLTIIGTVKTSNGEDYQYPLVIKML